MWVFRLLSFIHSAGRERVTETGGLFKIHYDIKCSKMNRHKHAFTRSECAQVHQEKQQNFFKTSLTSTVIFIDFAAFVKL